MTHHIPYEWNESLFCEEDIVAYLTEHQPWDAWIHSGNEPGEEHAEKELDSIAEYFGIDRDDAEEVERNGFPRRLPEPPDPPGFCSGCLNHFS